MVLGVLIRALVVVATALLGSAGTPNSTGTVLPFAYDGNAATLAVDADGDAAATHDQRLRDHSPRAGDFEHSYDDRAQVARASARLDGYRLAPRAIGPVGNPAAFPNLTTTRPQLEAKFKHAADFGVIEGRGAAGFEAFGKSIEDFMAAPGTVRAPSRWRGNSAILNYDLTSRLVVVQHPSGSFWTGFRMSPAATKHVFRHGSLGGG